MTPPLQVTDETFENEVLNAGQPVLVSFWAPWSQPCEELAPVVSELAGEYTGRVKVVHLNVEEHPRVTNALHIMSLPTVAVFLGNEAVDFRVGVYPKRDYQNILERALGMEPPRVRTCEEAHEHA